MRTNLEQKVENVWVVAYNPKLMNMFHCHMNVELCLFRVGEIKCIFKYICTGSDRFIIETAEETGQYDEIEQLQDARYVSASESARTILAFYIVHNDPPVPCLEVQKEVHHAVYFRQGEEMPTALADPQIK